MSRKETNIFNLDETKKKTTRVKEERIKEQDIVEILELPDTEEDDYKEALAESIKEKPRPFSHLPVEDEIEEEQPTKLEIFLKDFFAENLLAKI
ncbi:MAG: hypothetical protein LBC61_06350 [Candidatus Peribacteria bacterium]|jgi:hypothetical protein|nr:hypothetical protein [Candidatus Peribacteria bacterium]